MNARRQDAWTSQDDKVLADITIKYIREGGTQLTAFEEAGELLGRTAAACGFRWNSFVRKQYTDIVKSAKIERNKRTFSRRIPSLSPSKIYKQEFEATGDYVQALDNMINTLSRHQKDLSDLHRRHQQTCQQIEDQELRIRVLEREHQDLRGRLIDDSYAKVTAQDDYKDLMKIIDKVRTLSAPDGESARSMR